MSDARRSLGDHGERLAEQFVKEKGYRLLERQYRAGRREVDLICLDGEEVVFIEVKTRRGQSSGYPEESVTNKKLHHIQSVAEIYLEKKGWQERVWRIDVLAVLLENTEKTDIEHFIGIDISEEIW